MVSSSTSELLKGLRSSSMRSQVSSTYSSPGASPLKSYRAHDGVQSEHSYSVSEYQPARRKINWQVSDCDQKSDRISSSRMKASHREKEWESPVPSYASSSISSSSYHGNDITTSCNEKELLSTFSSSRKASDIILSARESTGILSSSTSMKSRSSNRSSQSAEDDLEDLDRKIQKIHKALARLESETSDLNLETKRLQEVNLNIKNYIRGKVDSSSRSSKEQLLMSVDFLKSQLMDKGEQITPVEKPDSYLLSGSAGKLSSYKDDIPELSLSLSDDSTDSMDDFEFEVMSQARSESIRSKTKSSKLYSSGSSTRSSSSSPSFPYGGSNAYSSSSTRSSSVSRTQRPPLPFSSGSKRSTSPLIVLRGQ